ncbi:MAG: exosortase-associated EpsI family protein [Phycisphaerae bacterium]|nr:exosortase-associated EpsI family protein [Tepidisphaeraceae bacterium]
MRTVDRVARVLAVVLVGVAVAERVSHIPPASAAAYHARVAAAFGAFPRTSGNWTSADRPVPEAARRLLRPNVILSRSYTNALTGRRCSVLLVHCSDARDLLAHYPPNCYPGHGWKQVTAVPARWEPTGAVGGAVGGTVYEFSRGEFESAGGIAVGNVMILPDGRFSPDMEGVELAAADPVRRHFGVAQMQVIMDGGATDLERADLVTEMLALHAPLVRELQSP